jgi:hypothetical protein
VQVASAHPKGVSSRIPSNRIRFRLRTIDRWITAEVVTGHERLADILNREDIINGLLVTDRAWADEAPTPTDRDDEDTAEFAAINMSRVLFAVPLEDRADGPRDPFQWIKKRPSPVRVGSAQYEIDGSYYVVESGSLHNTIGLVRPQFFAIGNATIRDLSVLHVEQRHDIVLVIRRMVDYIMLR